MFLNMRKRNSRLKLKTRDIRKLYSEAEYYREGLRAILGGYRAKVYPVTKQVK